MVKRTSFILYFLPFLLDFMMGGIGIACPLLAIMLGASSFSLGILGFSPGIAYISLCFVFGKKAESWEKRNLLAAGVALYVVSSLIFIFPSKIYQLYLAMILIGIGAAMFWPTVEAWIAEIEDKRVLAERMGLFNVSWSTGLTLGPLIGGMLFGISLKLPFVFFFFVGLFSLFFVFKIEGESKKEKTEKLTFSSSNRSSHHTIVSRIANLTLWFSVGIIRYIFPKLATNLGISSFILGLLMFSLFASQTFTFYGLGKFSLWQYRTFPLLLFQVISFFGLLIIFFTDYPLLLFIAFVLIGAGVGMTHSSSLFHSVNVRFNKGSRAAIHEIFLATGGLLGPLIGGVVAQEISLRAPYLLACFVIGGGMISEVLISKFHSSKI